MVLLIRHPGDHDAGCDADQKRGNLRHHRVTNRQHGKAIGCFCSRHLVVHDADDHASNDIDDGNDQSSDRVAFHKLHGTIHAAVKLAFHGQQIALRSRFGWLQNAGLEIGIDAHLLARHGVQRKSRADFGNAFRSFGDDDELNDGHDQKHHDANHQISADHQLAEGFDHVTRIGMQENRFGGCDVQRQSKQGREQQDRGKR